MAKSLESLVKNKKILAVVCNQWGDTGKGKFSDYFAATWADVIARGTGGNNAGHTTVINGKKRIFHLVPSGIIYEDKVNVLGNGMVIDLAVLIGELDELDKENISYNNLMISEDAHVIMPYQIDMDKKKDASQKQGGVGSTGRGIGPCYSDKIARRGIMVRDIFNPDAVVKKIKKASEFYPGIEIKTEEILANLAKHGQRLKPFIRNTISEMHEFARQGKKILLEGAQGILLSIEYGTYPFVTSSDCSINGTAAGVGLSAKAVDMTLGIVKFPYMTRVGGGPFPTELGGDISENYCAATDECGKSLYSLKTELENADIPFEIKSDGQIKYNHHHPNIVTLLNSSDDFDKGMGIRLSGEEYGATTGRPRRTGWTDLNALKYAIGINGPDIILTKADVLQGAKTIRLATRYTGADNAPVEFTRDAEKLKTCRPSYTSFKGFDEDISAIKNYKDLPDGLKRSITFLEEQTGAKVRMVSVGSDQSETIIK
jgi:adenylosuccinate synthase